MRFEVRFNNGYYKSFDRVSYSDVGIFETRRDAEAAVSRMNSR